ncbi:MAG: hypothetical protein JW908_07425 [Anaerolineales bacterium]|nr:hypothetical protein [Anaerolineales bacterium]
MMIVLLFLSTFVIALVVSFIVVALFNKSIESILNRVVPDEISYAWQRYMRFAIFVFGIGGGVRVWDMEKYLTPQEPLKEVVQLSAYRWILEIYQTIISTLQSTAGILLAFFVFGLIAVVVVRIFETRNSKGET